MTEYLWVDRKRDITKTKEDFIKDLLNLEKIYIYNKFPNPYEMMVQFVASMVYGKETYLLDADFSISETNQLGISENELSKTYALDVSIELNNLEDVVNKIQSESWRVWLFTSGTTGVPKKICHSYYTLGRNVRQNHRHDSDIWAFAYRMSHMAGVQVLLQALVNQNRIIYIFDDLPQDIVAILSREQCTNISATPTFYRNLLPFMSDKIMTLKTITLGGERYDENLCTKLRKFAPDAKIHNVYASTEIGSIFASHGSDFVIPEQYKGLVRISPEHELCIHKSLLGNFYCESDWYNTHDVVEVDDKGALHFLSRKSDLINVGGYKVNPLEIEALIENVSGVKDCLVIGKRNSVLGAVLQANIVLQSGFDGKEVKRKIIDKLKNEVQSFKVPRLYHFVDVIERTRSGKKVRK